MACPWSRGDLLTGATASFTFAMSALVDDIVLVARPPDQRVGCRAVACCCGADVREATVRSD